MNKTVFWSWQSDLPAETTKDFIKQALIKALKKINAELELESANRIELDHDTKGKAGLVEIAATIFEKIEECEVFVGDVTPIESLSATSYEKKIPNPNVMIELGYALRELGHQRVITVANLAYGGRPEELPFDLRHRRGAITYDLKNRNDPDFTKKLKNLAGDLESALKVNLRAPREDKILKNPKPILNLTSKEMPAVISLRQDMEFKNISTLDEIKQNTPYKTVDDQKKSGAWPVSPLQMYPMPGQAHKKSFSEWTKDELDGYNKCVAAYYIRYEKYLEELKPHLLYLQRAIEIKLCIENNGACPATNIRTDITFPDNVFICETKSQPSPPSPPRAPWFTPNGINPMPDYIVPYSSSSHASALNTKPRISPDNKTIEYRVEKLSHNYYISIDPFTALLKTEQDIKDFEIAYRITADEIPNLIKGTILIKVNRAS